MSFKQFEHDIMNVFQPLLSDFVNSDEGKKNAVDFGNYLIDGKAVQHKSRTYSDVDLYKSDLFSGFIEIYESFNSLRDIETIVKGLTTRQSKIAKMRLLSYHIHNYLNENYILEKRLEQYPAKILRSSKRWNKNTKAISEGIKEAIIATFKNINSIRGKHVHSTRYSDSELERLSMLEHAITFADSRLQVPLIQLFKIEFGICRRKWLEKIQSNNDEIEKFLNYYFSAIRPFIFDQQGNVIVPDELKSA
jgi:hypothetical protein